MILPTERNVPVKGYPKSASWLLFGPPKVGKTELLSQFPDVLILDLENGAYHTNAHVMRISSMDELRDSFDSILGPDGKRFKTIGIDTLDIVYDWAEEETCAHLSTKLKLKIENVGEAPHGADWGDARRRLLGFVEACKTMDKNVVFLAHSKAAVSETGTVSSKTIDFPGKLAKRLPGKVDIIGYCYATKEGVGAERAINRYISFEPYEELEAGCRYKELNGKVIPMTFQAIKDCFDGKAPAVIKKAQAKIVKK